MKGWLGVVRLVTPLLVLAGSFKALAVEAPVMADAHVNSARPTANSGTISNLNVGGGYTTLLQFDLNTLPSGTTASQISRALLRLYCNRADSPGSINLQPVSGAWGEYSLTYSTLPALGSASQVVSVTKADAFVWVDVTALVQGWVTTPSSNNGVALTAASAAVQFDSKENDLTAHAPSLDIVIASQGPKGDTGPIGPAGPMGATGLSGAAGAVGPQGLQGAQGLQGVKGDAGSQGPVGPVGATGAAGPTGPTGATGSQGVVGPAGSPGLIYQGSYVSTMNYALGDVVVWQGASYVSLIATNHGNTPSLAPSSWGVLTEQGPAGPKGDSGATGAAGPQGVPGSVGPAGEQGPQGPQGIPGQAGAQGISGAQGPQGLQGPTGLQGPVGPVGMSFQGAYSASANYAQGDGVIYGTSGYVSLVAGNHGNTPDQSPSAWALFATGTAGQAGAAGAAGLQGPAGAQGPAGPQGVIGPQGATGPQGPAVANYTGNYSSTTNYAASDAVSYDGSTYISLSAGNSGHTPSSSPSYWAVLAAQGPAGVAGGAGSQGPAGPQGATGLTGATGPQGPPLSFKGAWLISQSYATGDAVSYSGSSFIALTANTGRQPDVSPAYWSALAQAGTAGTTGATGAQGPQGLQGPAGISYRATWSASIGYVANDAVFYNGSTYIAVATSLGAAPDLTPSAWALLAQGGSAGATGPVGTAASISIGSVTTGAAGTQASVTNSGTSSAAVLNFTIPQGAAGSSGSGSSGSNAASFASMYHAVSYNTSYYSISNTNASAAENSSVLTWLPSGCSSPSLMVHSEQSNTLVITLRAGGVSSMANTTVSCSVVSGGECTATGAVTIPAGNFIDLVITGPSGVSAGVWTALTCN